MARIGVFGGTGHTGGHVVAEGTRRGHTVASVSRSLPDQQVDGAGYLHVVEGGPLFDTPDFPADYRPESLEMADAHDDLRAAAGSLDWFYLSPPAGFGGFAPGEARGSYRVGGDVLLTDDEGSSFIGGADFATAIVDEIEQPAHRRARFTVAY